MSALEPLTLDVREDLRQGREPFGRIMAAVSQLQPGQSLRLLATFEPIPLLRVLGAKGFTSQSKQIGPGDWEVLFIPAGATPLTQKASAGVTAGQKTSAAAPAEREAAADEAPWPAPATTLDNRGLMPPEPMIRVLEALENLGPGEVLEVFNDRVPRFLYPELEKRGYLVKTETRSEGVRLLIRQGK